jgi:D-lactate dehydrogenase
MKIAFFEVERWERGYLKKKLRDHDLKLYSKALNSEYTAELTDTEIISVFIYSPLDRAVLEQLPQLRMIATRSTGFDHIDIAECRRRNITVCNVPYYGENTVAEHAFALILSLSRNLYQACVKRLTNDFSIGGLTGFDLKGKTLGVVGTGRIGLHVIRIAGGFGMNVLAYDAKPNELWAKILGFSYVPLEQLMRKADIVTLHVPYNKHTHHLINRDRLRLMPKGSYLINTARGAIVDTEALIEALDKNLAGAGLDVLEGEEFIKEDKVLLSERNKPAVLSVIAENNILLRKQNVVFTPHIAFNSREALERIMETTVRSISAFISGDKCHTV